MADKPLSILIIEDNEDDALLLIRLLRQNGYDPLYKQVWTESALREALTSSQWDLIVSDFHMPKFTGIDALSNKDIQILLFFPELKKIMFQFTLKNPNAIHFFIVG